MAEMQQRGIHIARLMLEQSINKEDILFLTKTLAAAAINTAWYNYAAGAKNVMRRTLTLPSYELMDGEIAKPLLIDHAAQKMGFAEHHAANLVTDGHERRRLYVKHKKIIGLTLGNTALELANVPFAEELGYSEDPKLQKSIVRHSALQMLEDSRTLYKQVGSNPTLAQLSDNDSPLSVYWRRNAPDTAYEALEQAIES
jgi:hypothetical protein